MWVMAQTPNQCIVLILQRNRTFNGPIVLFPYVNEKFAEYAFHRRSTDVTIHDDCRHLHLQTKLFMRIDVQEISFASCTVDHDVESALLVELHLAVHLLDFFLEVDQFFRHVFALIIAELVVFDVVSVIAVVHSRFFVSIWEVLTLLFLVLFVFLIQKLLVAEFFLLLGDASADFLCGKIIGEA